MSCASSVGRCAPRLTRSRRCRLHDRWCPNSRSAAVTCRFPSLIVAATGRPFFSCEGSPTVHGNSCPPQTRSSTPSRSSPGPDRSRSQHTPTGRIDLSMASHDAHLDAFDEWISTLCRWLLFDTEAANARSRFVWCRGRKQSSHVPTFEVVVTTTMGARQFNQDVSAAKRQAVQGPVVITDRGEPAFVLISIADYEAMRDNRSLIDVLQMDEDIEFEPVVSRALPRGADL